MIQVRFSVSKWQVVNGGELEIVRDVKLPDRFLQPPVVLIC